MDKWLIVALVTLAVTGVLYVAVKPPAALRAANDTFALAVAPSAVQLGEEVLVEAQARITLDERQALYHPLAVSVTGPGSYTEELVLAPGSTLDCSAYYCNGTFHGTYHNAYAEGVYTVAGTFNGRQAAASLLVYGPETAARVAVVQDIGAYHYDSFAAGRSLAYTLYTASYTKGTEHATVFVYTFTTGAAAGEKLAASRRLSPSAFVPARTANATVLYQQGCCAWWVSGNATLVVSSTPVMPVTGSPMEPIIAAYLERYPPS
ncbi:MAG: hypothetical protein HYY37_03745 [Candidatus Aenigmarchaeota archaeon]|nr:hypothetical protein [Candidatus Aenigmarchaeota archaeon]